MPAERGELLLGRPEVAGDSMTIKPLDTLVYKIK